MQYVPLLIAIVFSSAVGRIAQKSLNTLLWRFDVRPAGSYPLQGTQVTTVELIEVAAKDMLPGDLLCTDTANHEMDAYVSAESRINSAVLQTRSFTIAWDNLSDLSTFPTVRDLFWQDSHRIEHVSHGPWKARVVTKNGAIIRVPKDRPVAVVRKSVAR